MSLFKIAWRSIQQRLLSSTLTAFSMALGVALVVAVLVVHAKVQESFDRTAAGYELIVGAKGGRYELVLNSVFYLGQPVGNLKYEYYKKFLPADPAAGRPAGEFAKNGAIMFAIPICMGDSYTSGDYQFRVVATVPDFFDKLEYARDKHYEFAAGRNFKTENFYEAVLGSVAAAQTGLKVGDKFRPEHGVPEEAGLAHVHDAFEVVGVLEPTGTRNDWALFINVEGFYKMPEHVGAATPARPTPAKSAAASGAGKSAEKPYANGSSLSEAHDDHAHADEKHEDHAHTDEKHEDHAHTDEKHEDHAHGDEKHEDHAHADEKHEDHAHADEKHEDHAHDDEKHEDHAHEHVDDDHAHEGDAHDHGHDHAHSDEPVPESLREVSAILIRFQKNAGLARASLARDINRDPGALAVSPLQIATMMRDNYIGPLKVLLLTLAGLVIVVSAVGVMVSIYNTMNDRRREIAILRSLGAARSVVMAIVMCESLLLSLAGCAAGFVLGHATTASLNPILVPRTGVSIGLFDFSAIELAVVPALGLASALVGFVPALTAYRTDVAKTLSATG